MKICAIVLNFRDAVSTLACLRSLIGQGLYALLLVDNSAHSVSSNELDRSLILIHESLDYKLRVVRPERNLGFSQGVNLVLAEEYALESDAFLVINNDAAATHGMLEQLASSMDMNQVPAAAPRVVDEAGTKLPMLWYQRYFGLQLKRRIPGSFPYLSGCCILVRRDMVEAGKLFDEDFFMYGEDTFLGWQMAEAGLTPLVVDQAIVRHDLSGSRRGGTFFYEFHMLRAHFLLARKTSVRSLEFPLILTCKTLSMLVRAIWRCFRFESLTPLKAYWLSWSDVYIRAN